MYEEKKYISWREPFTSQKQKGPSTPNISTKGQKKDFVLLKEAFSSKKPGLILTSKVFDDIYKHKDFLNFFNCLNTCAKIQYSIVGK